MIEKKTKPKLPPQTPIRDNLSLEVDWGDSDYWLVIRSGDRVILQEIVIDEEDAMKFYTENHASFTKTALAVLEESELYSKWYEEASHG